ncbi:MAG: hypothetical protein MUF58_16905 [Arcicella sp.]|jgi:hypothetical protein|nr:hypothetical protein [Arcicella sp.]
MKIFLLTLSIFFFCHSADSQIFTQAKAEKALQNYRDNLALLRKEHSNGRNLPNVEFFLFGMGDRLKMIYKNGMLINAKTQKVLRRWKIKSSIIVPSEYLVHLELENGKALDIQEDSQGVYIYENNIQIIMAESGLNLPNFDGKKFAPVLRVLHHEILMNIDEGLPLANFMVYSKPTYRNAAMPIMAISKTNNLNLIINWVTNLKEPYNRSREGNPEIDNFGQVLYIISTVSDRNHPLIEKVLEEADLYKNGEYIEGKTNDTYHPVYQTKWMKYGLKSLGIADSYKIPLVYDNHSPVFWVDYKTQNVGGRQFDEPTSLNSPYLTWAEDHTFNQKRGIVSLKDYPLSWESEALEANYSKMAIVDNAYANTKICATHAWHAAEMFLLLLEQK